MENKSHALAAGLFVLAVTALLIGLSMWLMRDVTNTTTYEMVTDDAVTGLQPQAAVRYKGVSVGKVSSISFDPAKRGDVLVRIAVAPDTPITQSTFATLAFQGVTGLSFVQLDDEGTSSDTPTDGPYGVPRIPLKEGALGQLTERIGSLMSKLDQISSSVNEAFGPENQAALHQVLVDAATAAKNVGQMAATVDKTVRVQLDPTRLDLPRLVRQTTTTLQAVEGAAQEAKHTLVTVNGAAKEAQLGIQRVTAPGGLVDRMSDGAGTFTTSTLPRIQRVTEDAGHTFRRIDRLTDSFGTNPQALLYGNGPIPPGPGEPGFGSSDGTSR
jgi:phospholipid/cholesterol/gamma-HCH transport system substrate-binding protein